MQLAFNARILATESLRGWSRYAANLIRELSFLDAQIHLLTDRRINKNLLEGSNWSNLEVHTLKTPNYAIWEQWILPQKCESLKVDLLHCPHHFGLPFKGNFKKVVTIHDTIEDSFYNKQKTWQERIQPSELQMDLYRWATRFNADHILTVSETSRRDIINYYGVPPEKISVTYNAADPIFIPDKAKPLGTLQEKFPLAPPYFFYVGGFDKRKNIPFLLQVFKLFLSQKKAQLVIAGAHYQEIEALAKETWSDSELKHLLFIDGPTDVDLVGLFRHAHCFLYPSLYEGFGLQIAESLKMGTPVLASRASCFPEILGNDDCLFDPHNINELVKLMSKTIDDMDFYQSIKDKSQKRGLQFSWKDTAEKTYRTYRSLVSLTKMSQGRNR